MGKVSKETRREQRYNANLHNLFVKAQEEIANKYKITKHTEEVEVNSSTFLYY